MTLEKDTVEISVNITVGLDGISIVGAPVACADGVKETWRELAGWFAGQLRTRCGEQVEVTYYDLFDPDCPPLPPGCFTPAAVDACA